MLLRGGGKCGVRKKWEMWATLWRNMTGKEGGWAWPGGEMVLNRGLSTFGCRERQGFKTQEGGINEAGPLKKQEWDQRGGGGTTLNSCLTGESNLHPNQPLLASGPCLTGRTLWSFTSTVWSTSLCCVDDASLGGHIWGSDNTILTVSWFWLSISIHHLKCGFQRKHIMPHGICCILLFFPKTDAAD